MYLTLAFDNFRKIYDIFSYIGETNVERRNIFLICKFVFSSDTHRITFVEIERNFSIYDKVEHATEQQINLANVRPHVIRSYGRLEEYLNNRVYFDRAFETILVYCCTIDEETDKENNSFYPEILLFLQWTLLMSLYPIEIDQRDINFSIDLYNSCVRIFLDDDSTYNIDNSIVVELNNNFADDDDNDDISKRQIEPIKFNNFDPISTSGMNFSILDPSNKILTYDDYENNKRKIEQIDKCDIITAKRKRYSTIGDQYNNTSDINNIITIINTSEQIRILSLIERLEHKKFVINGVAGTGKTFLLFNISQKYDKIVYLVKKRSFLQCAKLRFKMLNNLNFQTIDSFLMNALGVKSLKKWLDHLNSFQIRYYIELAYKLQFKYNSRDTLYFLDEYSLVETNLVHLLNILLARADFIMVGDYEQQSPIGSDDSQPFDTMLSLNRTIFMYESVRSKDIGMTRRLNVFKNEFDDLNICQRAILGLPYVTTIAIKPNGPLPKIIVSNNEKVNYLNWSICRALMTLVNGLSYYRKILNNNQQQQPDYYTDELFIIPGLIYRMIKRQNGLDKGSRVRITEILSEIEISCVDILTNRNFILYKTFVEPYEFNDVSKLNGNTRYFMFPCVCDVATTVYQIQGITLNHEDYPECYIDLFGMHKKSLYVSLSRFEYEYQIAGVINAEYFANE